ncbi:VOC family protein [Streptomyces celluloflavus]|uniref:VOC family protein n=1 Tax=Streptomyces celluloflavus TaxID=58344 RepID=UPI00369E1FD9
MAILRRGDLQLLVDSLTGMPFSDSDREHMTSTGPRGLGVVIGIEVDNVDAIADYYRSAGATVTTDPLNAPWGERYAECLDPYDYAWKFYQLLPDPPQNSTPTTVGSPDPHAIPTMQDRV